MIYDLPQLMYNSIRLRFPDLKNKTLRDFAKAVPKADFLKQGNIGPKKIEALNQILKSYGIKWKKR